MKDRRCKNVFITYQGEGCKHQKDTLLFYVQNNKQKDEIGTIKKGTDGNYGLYKQGATFDVDCMKDIRSFLEELNKSIK